MEAGTTPPPEDAAPDETPEADAAPEAIAEAPEAVAAPEAAPARNHAGLAFVLALLAVPGSTLAWDLPAGGWWIGAPLAAAAIVFGVRALRRDRRSWMAIAAVAIAGLMLGLMIVWKVAELAT